MKGTNMDAHNTHTCSAKIGVSHGWRTVVGNHGRTNPAALVYGVRGFNDAKILNPIEPIDHQTASCANSLVLQKASPERCLLWIGEGERERR
jgi:hypothetical protein